MNNAAYTKTMENLRNRRIDLRIVNNKKDIQKCKSKPSYMSQKYSAITQLQYKKVKLH